MFDIFPPESVRYDPNVTLHFDVDKVALQDLGTGYDRYAIESNIHSGGTIQEFTPPCHVITMTGVKDIDRNVEFTRSVTLEELKTQRLNTMPGFIFSWH